MPVTLNLGQVAEKPFSDDVTSRYSGMCNAGTCENWPIVLLVRGAILASGTIRCPTVVGSYLVKSKAATYLLFLAYLVIPYAV